MIGFNVFDILFYITWFALFICFRNPAKAMFLGKSRMILFTDTQVYDLKDLLLSQTVDQMECDLVIMMG